MRNIPLVYFTTIILFCAACKHHNDLRDRKAISRQLQVLLNQKEYFRLRLRLESAGDSMSHEQRLYFQAFTDNAFNRNEQAINEAESVLNTYGNDLSDSLKAAMYLLKADSYFKIFNYAGAAAMDSMVIHSYQTALDSGKIKDVANSYILYNALKDVPPQQTTIEHNTVLPWKKDKVGLIEIPVESHLGKADGIFDTRANISSISQTYAKKLGLKMLKVSYEEGSGITGIKFKTGLGLADSLFLGSILIRNVVFQVMPDSVLYIAPIKFSMNIIIGFPVIEQLKEVRIDRNGQMDIPLQPSEDTLHNLALDGLDPVIELRTDTAGLPFYFDSGAGTSDFYDPYFKKYKTEILQKGYQKTVQFGGAGGTRKNKVWVLPSVRLYLGNKKVTVDSVSVLTSPFSPSEKFYGNIGEDFISQFGEITLNFEDMYVKAE